MTTMLHDKFFTPKIGDVLIWVLTGKVFMYIGDNRLVNLDTRNVFVHLFFSHPEWKVVE